MTEEFCNVREDLLDARRPESKPKDHKLIRLVIEDCRIHHTDVRAVLAELWAMHWASKSRLVVNLGGCTVCRKVTGRPHSAVPTAALPEIRAWEDCPFHAWVCMCRTSVH